MSSTTRGNLKPSKELPVWALPVALLAAVLIVGLIAFRALSGGSEAAGPDKVVRPGMYDFRQEAQKGNIGRRTNGEGDNAP